MEFPIYFSALRTLTYVCSGRRWADLVVAVGVSPGHISCRYDLFSKKIQSIYILAARIFRSMRMMAGITVSNVRCLRKTINSIIYSINGCGFWRKEVSASRPHNSDTWHGSIFDRFVSIISNLSEFLSAFGGLLY